MLTAPAAQAGDVRIQWRLTLPGVLHALFPVPAPVLGPGHLGVQDRQARKLHGSIAIDGRTFFADGVHFRVHGLPAQVPGSPEERAARGALQALLDSGVYVQVLAVESSGVRSVTLAR